MNLAWFANVAVMVGPTRKAMPPLTLSNVHWRDSTASPSRRRTLPAKAANTLKAYRNDWDDFLSWWGP